MDTDLITTQIYSQIYFNQVPGIVFELQKKVEFDLYLFLDIDVPWVEDSQRDLGETREEMKEIFISELEKRNIPYEMISGDWDTRFEKAKQIINKLLNNEGG